MNDISRHALNWIGGTWVDSDQVGTSINPATYEPIGPYADAGPGTARSAIAAGAKAVVRGGPVINGPLARGAFYRPTLLDVADPGMNIVHKEMHGPVVTFQVFSDEQDAVGPANDSEYGPAASIWTRDVDRGFRVACEIDAGTLWINTWAVIHDESEEGGYKQSGIRRLNSPAAIEYFVEYRTVIHEVTLQEAYGYVDKGSITDLPGE